MIDSPGNLLSYESPFYQVFAIGQDRQDTAFYFLSASDVDISSRNCDTYSYSKRKIALSLFLRRTDKWSPSYFKASRAGSSVNPLIISLWGYVVDNVIWPQFLGYRVGSLMPTS